MLEMIFSVVHAAVAARNEPLPIEGLAWFAWIHRQKPPHPRRAETGMHIVQLAGAVAAVVVALVAVNFWVSSFWFGLVASTPNG